MNIIYMARAAARRIRRQNKPNCRRGSIITEAAIMLPIYIVAVVTFVYLVRAACTDIIVFSTVENQVRKAAAQKVSLTYIETKKALDEAGADGSRLSLLYIPEITVSGDVDNLVAVYFDYSTQIKIPAAIRDEIVLKNVLITREWNGKEIKGNALGFDKMAVDETGQLVCVFPRSGGKYHGTDCRYVNSYAVEKKLNAEIMEKYKPCPLCTDGSEKKGQTVYVFRYGGSYHNSSCDSVDKYVIDMDRADAVIKDYSPCSVCGGK